MSKRLPDDKTVVRLPMESLPDGVRAVTRDEVHSVAIGSSGVTVGLCAATGGVLAAVALTVSLLLVATSLGLIDRPHWKTTATLQREPWYFLASHAISLYLGAYLAHVVL